MLFIKTKQAWFWIVSAVLAFIGTIFLGGAMNETNLSFIDSFLRVLGLQDDTLNPVSFNEVTGVVLWLIAAILLLSLLIAYAHGGITGKWSYHDYQQKKDE